MTTINEAVCSIEKQYRHLVSKTELETLKRAERIMVKLMPGDSGVVTSPEDVRAYLRSNIGECRSESLVLVCLNNRHKVVDHVVFDATYLNKDTICMKELVKRCLASNAAAIICCHVHSCGDNVTDNDIRLARFIVDSFAHFDVRTLDYFIHHAMEFISLGERGFFVSVFTHMQD